MRIIAAILIIIGLTACSGSDTSGDPVGQAQAFFEAGNYDRVQKTCDRLIADSTRFNALDVTRLCCLAELYVRLDTARASFDTAAAESNEASAVWCLGRARQLDADSVDAFISSRPRERASRLAVISIVSTYLSIPRDSLVVEDEQIYDSL